MKNAKKTADYQAFAAALSEVDLNGLVEELRRCAAEVPSEESAQALANALRSYFHSFAPYLTFALSEVVGH